MGRTKYTPRMDKYKPGLILSPPFILPDFTTAWCLTYPVPTYAPLRPVMIGTPRLWPAGLGSGLGLRVMTGAGGRHAAAVTPTQKHAHCLLISWY